MTYYIKKIEELGLYERGHAVLVIGSFDGREVAPLRQLGLQVTIIEPNPSTTLRESTPDHLVVARIQDWIYQTDQTFDIVICHNVLHYMHDEFELWTVVDALWDRCNNVMWFSAFGPNDAWFERVTTTTKDHFIAWLAGQHVHHFGEVVTKSHTYDGTLKRFHIFSALVQK